MTTGQFNATIDTPVGIHPATETTSLTAGVRTGLILDIEANGQIVGGVGGVSGDFTLTRFNGDGSVDTTFGSDGVPSGVAEPAGMAGMTPSAS